jgi:outer membrane immunogenic protein
LRDPWRLDAWLTLSSRNTRKVAVAFNEQEIVMKFHLILAATLTGWSFQAYAQDFDGPSVGIQAGWSNTDVGLPGVSERASGIDRSTDAFIGGGFLAYDHEVLPRIVIGAQAEFNIAASDDFGKVSQTSSVRVNPKYAFDLTARAGYLATPETLIYLRGGYSNARVRTSIITDTKVIRTSANRDGWLIGGGAERLITDHFSARLEYRYSDLGEGPGKFDRHQILVGGAYRF